MTPTPFHIQVIKETLSKRQRTNASYSLRAYGRDLGLDASTLSQVLKGRRPLPLKDCNGVAARLRLAPAERMRFIESACARRTPLLDQLKISNSEDRVLLDESQYRVLAEWEHYAALTLADLGGFTITPESVSKKLGISRIRAEAVIQNLLNAKLIHEEDGRFVKSQDSVHTTEDISSQALRDSHLEALELGKKKLESVPVELRDFSSINVALDMDQLTELKAIVREFRKKVSALASSGKDRREIYQLAIQVYPLSDVVGERTHPRTKNSKTTPISKKSKE